MSYMTPDEAAAKLSTSAAEVRRLVNSGQLRGIERNGKTLVDRASVLSRQSANKPAWKPSRDHGGGFGGF